MWKKHPIFHLMRSFHFTTYREVRWAWRVYFGVFLLRFPIEVRSSRSNPHIHYCWSNVLCCLQTTLAMPERSLTSRFKSLYRWIEFFNFSSYTQTNNLSRQSRSRFLNKIELFCMISKYEQVSGYPTPFKMIVPTILALISNRTVCFDSAELELSLQFPHGTLSQTVLMDKTIHFDNTQSA